MDLKKNIPRNIRMLKDDFSNFVQWNAQLQMDILVLNLQVALQPTPKEPIEYPSMGNEKLSADERDHIKMRRDQYNKEFSEHKAFWDATAKLQILIHERTEQKTIIDYKRTIPDILKEFETEHLKLKGFIHILPNIAKGSLPSCKDLVFTREHIDLFRERVNLHDQYKLSWSEASALVQLEQLRRHPSVKDWTETYLQNNPIVDMRELSKSLIPKLEKVIDDQDYASAHGLKPPHMQDSDVVIEPQIEVCYNRINTSKPKHPLKKKKGNPNQHPVGCHCETCKDKLNLHPNGCQCTPCKDKRSEHHKQNNSVIQEPKEIKVHHKKKQQSKGY